MDPRATGASDSGRGDPSYILVAASPKSGQIARDLNRPMGGRQKFNDQGDPATGNRRMYCEAE